MGRYPGRTNAPTAAVISTVVEIANFTMNTPTTDAGNPKLNMCRIVKEAISANISDSARLKGTALSLTQKRRQRPSGRLFFEKNRRGSEFLKHLFNIIIKHDSR